ncbi:hypothetical protein [Alkaliphilus hydrothermalis]|uniref:DNA-directed RNA polymerase subunit RPC12/RpoP n=1 Tax=Alkaliphilus hydrothermalis TaxID=1482730 RepID=A0ABS2NTN7_9FIRM|nr:hypothetical protein [Alkaliphilus hydrothermalis]MBM7616227.1 DNA-directed RNA polymerase subunit RPC12/RpoP [Alkaliphilus hydrothermalis]
MELHQAIQCPQCSNENFLAKYESTYVYSYKIESDDTKNAVDNTLPFMFDNREQKNAKQYIECRDCGAQYPCHFTLDSEQVDFTIVQKALRGDYAENPEFFG